MATIKAFNSRFQSINIKSTIQEACRVSGFDIIESIRHQMKRGERGDGLKIGKYNSPVYAIEKEKQNPLAGFGNVDLYLKGSFQGGMYIKFGNLTFTIGSNDEKAPKLEGNYGQTIYQPNAETRRTEIVPVVYKRLLASLKQQMGLS
jgi:hypothetical protein